MLDVPVPYDPVWPERFVAYRADIATLTGIDLTAVHHIGSTAVEGLRSKPIIDIQISVPNLTDFHLERLNQNGYTPVPHIDHDDPFPDAASSPGGWQKKYARLERGGQRRAHIHIRQIDAPNHRFALMFRDYLRANPSICDLYADFKQSAAAITVSTSDAGGSGQYLALKNPFVKLLGHGAEHWAEKTGWPEIGT